MSLPYNIETERSVINQIITYNNKELLENINQEYFYDNIHKTIISELKKNNNIETVIDTLKLDIVNIQGIVEDILINNKRISTIEKQVENLSKLYKFRKMIEFGQYLQMQGYNKKDIETNELKTFEDSINDVSEETLKTLYELTKEYVDDYDKKPQFIKTSLKSFDRWFFMERGDLVCIAARPSMGKTAFQLQLAINFSFNNYKTIAFSFEMKDTQLIQRVIGNINNSTLQSIREKNLSKEEKENLENRLKNHLKKIPLKISDKNYNLEKIKSIILKEKKENGLDIVMIDYLQLMKVEKARSRNEEIGEITRELKIFAKEKNILIIILAQLSRATEQRADKRPILSDLRDSGEIEQDLDSCLMLYRDEYYNINSEFKNILDVICRKQRQGQTGEEKLYFNAEKQKITELYDGY